MTEVTLDDITLSKDAQLDDVLQILNKYGVAKLTGWLDEDTVVALCQEQEKLYGVGGPGVNNLDYPRGKFARLKRGEIDPTQLPTITRVFSDPYMEQVARRYMSGDFLLNEEIFVTDDEPNDADIVPMHYDRIRMFKFYIYLADTTKADGAFSLIPGTQTLGSAIRKFYISRGKPVIEMPNKSDIPKGLPKPLAIEGNAGDMIIFDTDAYHLGASVYPDHRRRVMRGHTWYVPGVTYNPTFKNHKSQWFQEWALNPFTFMRRVGDTLSGRRVPDRWDG